MNYQRIMIGGRLTRDPELRYTGGGTAVCNFSVAVNRRVKINDEWKEETTFFDCVAFAKRGEAISEYFRRGSEIFVEGEMQRREWESKDGQKKNKWEVLVQRFEFIGGRPEESPADSSSDDTPPPINDAYAPF